MWQPSAWAVRCNCWARAGSVAHVLGGQSRATQQATQGMGLNFRKATQGRGNLPGPSYLAATSLFLRLAAIAAAQSVMLVRPSAARAVCSSTAAATTGARVLLESRVA